MFACHTSSLPILPLCVYMLVLVLVGRALVCLPSSSSLFSFSSLGSSLSRMRSLPPVLFWRYRGVAACPEYISGPATNYAHWLTRWKRIPPLPLHREQNAKLLFLLAGGTMTNRSLMVKPPYRRWEFDSPRQWHKRAYNGEGLLHECLGHHETPHDSLTDADRCIVHIAASLQFCQLNLKQHSHSITKSHMLAEWYSVG